jgi:hypothetical protein
VFFSGLFYSDDYLHKNFEDFILKALRIITCFTDATQILMSKRFENLMTDLAGIKVKFS